MAVCTLFRLTEGVSAESCTGSQIRKYQETGEKTVERKKEAMMKDSKKEEARVRLLRSHS